MNSLFFQAVGYGFISGTALVPVSLGLWLVYASTRTFAFSVIGGYLISALVLKWSGSAAIWWSIPMALGAAIVFGILNGVLFKYVRSTGASEANQLIFSMAVLQLLLTVATGIGLSEPVAILGDSDSKWIRGLLGLVGIGILAALLQSKSGRSVKLVIQSPLLSKELGIPVAKLEYLAFAVSSFFCGVTAVIDSCDSGIGAGIRGVFPYTIQATLATLVVTSAFSFGCYYGVAVACIVLSLISAGAAFVFPEVERLISPLLLLVWLIWSYQWRTK